VCTLIKKNMNADINTFIQLWLNEMYIGFNRSLIIFYPLLLINVDFIIEIVSECWLIGRLSFKRAY
jgi:hypothetical protein